MHDFAMPKVGMSDDETMVISQWLVATGGPFAEGQALLEIETAKANMEVEASEAGVLAARLRDAGGTVRPGDVIALIAQPGESVDPEEVERRSAQAGGQVDPGTGSARDHPETMAEAAATAAQPDGEITGPGQRGDVSDSSATEGLQAQDVSGLAATPSDPQDHANGALLSVDQVDFSKSGQLYGVPLRRRSRRSPSELPPGSSLSTEPTRHLLSRHRKALARMMMESSRIPQFSVHREMPMFDAARVVEDLRARGIPSTLTDVLLRVTAHALLRHPEINCQFIDDMVYQYPIPAVALATDSPSGVLAPVVRDVERLSWQALARERRRLVEGARSGHLSVQDLSGGTFAISNVGALHGDAIIPMLMPPQIAILGFGRIRAGWGQSVATAVVTGDHRVLDGADAARFLGSLAELLQHVSAAESFVGGGADA